MTCSELDKYFLKGITFLKGKKKSANFDRTRYKIHVLLPKKHAAYSVQKSHS